ncbi:MAG: hypothetical protein OHK0039_40480 [Bacteroidia bacterium]
MKKFTRILLALALLGTWASCEDEYEAQAAIDKQLILDYVADQGWVGAFTENDVFYVIDDPGAGGETPVASSTVEVIYTGYLLDGTEFDSSDGFPVRFSLFNVITGWREGMQKFPRESKGKLVIPSRLAYGPRGSGSAIPANSVLVFHIELLDFE